MLLETIRTWQFTKMALNIQSYAALVAQFPEEDLTTYRDNGDGWTVLEVLGHLRDFEALFFERAQATVDEDNPPLRFPDPDELARENAYSTLTIADVLASWQATREKHIAFLRGRDEDEWERAAQHPTRGKFTLHDQLFLTTLHDSIHLEQIMRILTEKKVA